MNVLVTSASRKVGLVQAFQQALAQYSPGKVIAVDTDALCPALYVADECSIVPPDSSPGYQSAILGLCERFNVNLIIPTRDEELPYFARSKEIFSRQGVTVMVADSETVGLCQNKKRFINFCRDHGFEVPRSWLRSDLPDSPTYPLFVKPCYGKGGRSTMIIDSPDDLLTAMQSIDEPIFQEYVDAPEFTIDVFLDFQGTLISVVPRERLRVVAGESYVGRTRKIELLIGEAARFAKKLKLIGHNTIQCFLEDKVVKFIEVNPRFGGGANLGFAAGAHTPCFLVRSMAGEKVQPVIGMFRDNYIMMRYTQDLFLDNGSLLDSH